MEAHWVAEYCFLGEGHRAERDLCSSQVSPFHAWRENQYSICMVSYIIFCSGGQKGFQLFVAKYHRVIFIKINQSGDGILGCHLVFTLLAK